jgi:hypothetical protein
MFVAINRTIARIVGTTTTASIREFGQGRIGRAGGRDIDFDGVLGFVIEGQFLPMDEGTDNNQRQRWKINGFR